ncbi:MAG: thiamine phosphate synthase [Abditibacteriota bacterium]|nr:thiamine phosphate synthase [Abditibacteriota bacterium]
MFDYSKIVCVTNRKLVQGDFLKKIDQICSLGVRSIILREKDLPLDEYLSLTKNVLKICKNYNVPLFAHNSFEAGKITGNLHLSYDKFINILDKIKDYDNVGVSVHSIREIEDLEIMPNYFLVGHIFSTDCKKDLPPRGLKFLEEICKISPVPVYGIGGINESNYKSVLEAGASACGVMSGLMK